MEGNDIAYVRITSFSEQTTASMERAINRLKEEAASKLKASFGPAEQSRRFAGPVGEDFRCVPEPGEIVSTRSRRADEGQRFNAKPGDITEGLPIVILVNGGSASASEIVAGALQDHRRAIILGTRTFGKGSVQTIIPLSGHGAIRLTTARYYTPSGRSIQARVSIQISSS